MRPTSKDFWQIVGVVVAIVSILVTIGIYLVDSQSSRQTQLPYALSQLSSPLAQTVELARQAQTEGKQGAHRAVQASARGREAAEHADAGDPGFEIVQRNPLWRGEQIDSRDVVYGVLSQGDQSASGEFRFQHVFADGVGGWGARTTIEMLTHVTQSEAGRFEGTGTGMDEVWLGPGRFTRANGDVFEGRWPELDGAPSRGVLLYGDGKRYEGDFERVAGEGLGLQPHGSGVLWSSDGRVMQAGPWSHGHPG